MGLRLNMLIVEGREGEVRLDAGETGVGGLEGMKKEGREATVEIMAT